MEAAKKLGQQTLPDFLKHFDAPAAGESDFSVKFNLDPSGPVEFIWATNLQRSGEGLKGQLSNQPMSEKFQMGQEVQIPLNDIIDWSYMKDGVAQGHHTTKVVMKTLSPEDAAGYKQALGWK
jgi:uncharacterized protein YegJ (DUF2314 family)